MDDTIRTAASCGTDNGWFVLRFDDYDVLDDLAWTVERIAQALEDPSSVVDPLNLHD